MKLILVSALALAAVGCDGEVYHNYDWTIERQGVSAEEFQRKCDVMAVNGWDIDYDDHVEKAGHYVYYTKAMKPSAASLELPKIKADLERK